MEEQFWQNYKNIYLLGSGSYGSVYSAVLKDGNGSETPVALKFVKNNHEVGCHQKILREISYLVELQGCPNVVCLRRVHFDFPGTVILEMELLHTDLRKFMYRRANLTPEMRSYIISGILRGLISCHKRGIVHADLKPENVCFDAEANVKIIDFGISRKITAGDVVSKTREKIQTAWYRAPELFWKEGTCSYASFSNRIDMWSLGCIWFYLITGTDWLEKCGDDEGKFIETIAEDLKYKDQFLNTAFAETNVTTREIDLISLCLTSNPVLRISAQDLLDNLLG